MQNRLCSRNLCKILNFAPHLPIWASKPFMRFFHFFSPTLHFIPFCFFFTFSLETNEIGGLDFPLPDRHQIPMRSTVAPSFALSLHAYPSPDSRNLLHFVFSKFNHEITKLSSRPLAKVFASPLVIPSFLTQITRFWCFHFPPPS